MVHRRHLAVVAERHAHALDRGRAGRIKAHVVWSRADHLDRLADRLGSERGGNGVVAVEPPTEAAAEQVGAHDNLVLAAAQRLGQHRQDQGLPLIAGVNFEDAVPFECQGVDRLQLKMHDRAGGVVAHERPFRRGEGGVDAGVIDHQGAARAVGDQLGGAALQILFRYVGGLARVPLDLHEIGGAVGRHEAVGADHDPTRHGA